MFNRALQVKVVKNDKHDPATQDVEMAFEDKVDLIDEVVERTLRRIGVAVVTYVAADTVRKILVAKASK